MPSIDDLKEGIVKDKPASFKKKPYRAWDLGDIQPEIHADADGEAPSRQDRIAPDPARQDDTYFDAAQNASAASAANESSAQGPATQPRTGRDAPQPGPVDNSKIAFANRAQKTSKQGTTTGHNRAQTPDQPGTEKNNRAQNGPQQGTTTGHNRAQKRRSTKTAFSASLQSVLGSDDSPPNPDAIPSNRPPVPLFDQDFGKNRAQNSSVPGSFQNCARLIEPLCPVSPPSTGHKTDLVPGSSELCAPLQPGTNLGLNRAQNFSQPGTNPDLNRAQNRPPRALPSSRQMLAILEFIAAQQQSTGLDHTPRLKRAAIAMNLGISLSGIKNQLARLCAGGHLERVEARDGRGDSGTVYRVPSHALKALQQIANRAQSLTSTGHKDLFNRAQSLTSTGHKNRAQEPGTNHSSSSVFINTTTTKPSDTSLDKKLYERFHEDVEDLGAKSLVSANDVMQVWRTGAFNDVEDLRESLEHALAYIRSEAAEGINNKKAWLIKTLGKGYYGKPSGHKSRAEIRLEEQRERAAKRRAQREASFEADFESWLLDLPPDERKAILGDRLQEGANFALPPRVLRNTLRDHFAQSQGLFEFVSGEGGAG